MSPREDGMVRDRDGIVPRTWAQAGTRTWDDVPTTWNEGVPA